MNRLPVFLALVSAVALNLAASALGDDNPEADRLIQEVIRGATTDAQRATKLLAASKLTASDALRLPLLEKATDYGISSFSAEGCQVAEQALDLLAEAQPDKKAQWTTKRLDLYRRAYRLLREDEDKASAGRKLVGLLAAVAGDLESQRRWKDAQDACREAIPIASRLELKVKDQFQAGYQRLTNLIRAQQRVEEYQRSLKANPENRSARTLLIRTLVIELDSPQEAAKHLDAGVDKKLSASVLLASRPVEDLDAAVCKTLGDWYYRELASEAPEYARGPLLLQAGKYYRRCLALFGEGDAETVLVKLALGEIEKLVGEAGQDQGGPEASGPVLGGKHLTLDLGDGVTMKFVLVPAGQFQMGSPAGETGRGSGETQHTVRISKAFYIGETEVTQAQWTAVMGTTPWSGKEYAQEGESNAASYIPWKNAAEFCVKLSERTGKRIRLPAEAEWEYACRAGSRTAYCFGNDVRELDRYAWHRDNAANKGEMYAHQVGQKRANAWGLFDMHGNVWEWCQDWYTEILPTAMQADPAGPASGSTHVVRGGSWHNPTSHCRSAFRTGDIPGRVGYLGGLRVILSLAGSG